MPFPDIVRADVNLTQISPPIYNYGLNDKAGFIADYLF